MIRSIRFIACLLLLLPVSAAAFLGGSPALVVPAVVAVQGSVGTLTFDEEFNNGTCSSIPCANYPRWKTNFYYGDQSNTISGLSSRVYGGPDSVNLDSTFVAATGGDPIIYPQATGGKLTIPGALMDSTNQGLYGFSGTRHYYTAVMTTQNSFSQTYGYFEIQTTFPNQAGSSACGTITPAQCLNGVPGAWPAFWMLPKNVTSDNCGNFPEIDVFENYGGQWVISATSTHTNASLAWSSGTVTATTTAPHGINIGDSFVLNVSGATPTGYNVTAATALSTGASTFTYPVVSDPGANTVAGNYVDISISSQTWSAGVVTATTSAPHGKTNGTQFNVVMGGASPAGSCTGANCTGYVSNPIIGNTATATGTYTFTYPQANDPGVSPASTPGTYGLGVMIDRVARPSTTLHYYVPPATCHSPATPITMNTIINTVPRIDLTVPHVVGVLWSPTEITTYVDQTKWFSITDPTALAQVSNPMYILLSMDISHYFGGAGDPLNGGVYPAAFNVDYVRAWSLK